MRVKIHLETITDIGNFVLAVSQATGATENVWVTNGDRCCVSAKAFLGLVAAREFNELWCESERDIYYAISRFAVD